MKQAVKTETFWKFKIMYREGTVDEKILAYSFSHDIFFPGVPEYQPSDNHTIIDVGAHIGTFSLLAASLVQKVYAIEASKDSFNLLKANIRLNNITNISAHHLALTDKQDGGLCRLYHAERNWGHSSVNPRSEHYEIVSSSTLESLITNNKIEKCNFMKLNCEGAEFPILLGTSRDILQRFDTILTLYHCDLWERNTEVDLLHHLEACGFNTIVRNRTEKRGWIIATRNR